MPKTEKKAASRASGMRARRAQIGLEKRVRSRLQLIRSAIRVIGQPNGHGASIDDVIADAGVSRGTFYNYFESRDHLFAVIAVELSQDFNDAIVAAMDGASDPAERGDIGVRNYLARARSDREWGWAMFNVALNGPLLGVDTVFHINDTVTRGMETGRFNISDKRSAIDMYSGVILSGIYTILTSTTDRRYISEASLLSMRAVGVPEADAQKICTSRLSKLQVSDRSHERSHLALSLAPQMYRK